MIYYAAYLGKSEKLTPDGTPTGQKDLHYADPVQTRASLASAKGATDIELFGTAVEYDRTMTTVQDIPMDEYSKVWIDKPPADGDANYTVQRKAPNLNQHVWALKKVVGQ